MPAPPPVVNEAFLSTNTTIMVVDTSNVTKTVIIPPTTATLSTMGRLLSIKGASDSLAFNSFNITCSTGAAFYPNFETASNIQAYSCVTLLEYPQNKYNIVNYYQGTFTNYVTGPDPGTTIVNVNGAKSVIFADLRTQSKVFVLPSITSLTSDQSQSPYFVFKDVYGSIATNTWYISTSGGLDTFEGLGTTIRFQSPNMAIEIAGRRMERGPNYWYILGGYGI